MIINDLTGYINVNVVSGETAASLIQDDSLFTFGRKLTFFRFEQQIESGQGAVAAADVLLHFHFVGVGQYGVCVDFLLEDAQLVADADDFMEEDFEGNFLGLERWVGWMQYDFAFLPADSQFGNDVVRFFQAETVNHSVNDGFDELTERLFEAGDGHVCLGGHDTAEFGVNGAEGVAEPDFGGLFGDGFDGSDSVLGMADGHADGERLNFHRGKDFLIHAT